MALNATDFVPKGPIRSADILQFVNLFTGVMTDQPVTFKNTLTVGGSQSISTVPLKLYGAIGQTGHLIDLYPDTTSLNPTFGFAATGAFGWGLGGTAVIDTTLSRIGGSPDVAGLVISPRLNVAGPIYPQGPITWPSGGRIQDAGAQTLDVGPIVVVQNGVYFATDRSVWVIEHTGQPGVLDLHNTLVINNADMSDNLTYSIQPAGGLAVRSPNLPAPIAWTSTPFSAQAFAENWLQFNVRFAREIAGVGWPGVSMSLSYDVDSTASAGGVIKMINGRIGLGGTPNNAGDVAQVMGPMTVNGALTTVGSGSAGRVVAGTDLMTTSGIVYFATNSDTYLQRTSPGQIQTNGNFLVNGTLDIGGGGVYVGLHATSATSLHLINSDLAMDAPRDINWPGGETISPGENIGRNATVYLGTHCYVFFDLGCGHNVTCVQLIQTSDPNLKSMTPMTDDACMAMVRDPSMPVQYYTIDPPATGTPQPPYATATNIGFSAVDVFRVANEFAATDTQGNPVGVNYANMSAAVWGALRQLDARCRAKGI